MLPLILGAIGSLAGGIGNFFANQSANERAEALQNKALQEWMQVNIPDPAQRKLALDQFVQTGKLVPQLEKAIQADPSAFQSIAANATYKNAQDSALKQLQDIGSQGGLRLQDKAALQDATQESVDRERGDRLAIAQQMANRGLGGSGFDVASRLQASQSGADRNARSSLNVAAQAQDRALQAIMNSGNMASQFNNQDYNQQAQRASALDKINMFNTQNMQDVQQRNTAALNNAQGQNLAEQQRVADQNVKQNNYQQEYNSNLLQQNFDNQAKKAAGMSGQYGQLANTAQQQGQNLGNLFSNMGQGVAGAATSQAQMDFWDKYFKNQKNGSSASSG